MDLNVLSILIWNYLYYKTAENLQMEERNLGWADLRWFIRDAFSSTGNLNVTQHLRVRTKPQMFNIKMHFFFLFKSIYCVEE